MLLRHGFGPLSVSIPQWPADFRRKMGRFSELIGTCPAIGHWLTILRMRQCMKAILYAQFQPVKTMKQFISDRNLFRTLALGMLLVNWCF